MAGGVTAGTVPSASEDFHGDGIVDGEVDVIRSARNLTSYVPKIIEESVDELLGCGQPLPIGGDVPFNREGSATTLVERNFPSSDGGVSGGGMGLPLLRSVPALPEEVAFSDIPDGPASVSEVFSDGGGLATDDPSYIRARLASFIEFVEISEIRDSRF